MNAKSGLRWRFTKFYTGVEGSWKEKSLHTKMEEEDEEACLSRPRDVETIASLCKQWVQDHVGVDFKFREHQLESIVTILDNILNKKTKINCVEAPTGSGKSWIAFVVSGVAWEYYRLSSYILVSDLGLMDQYMADVDKYKFNDIGRLKGLGNYQCDLNNFPFPSGDCKLAKVGYNILMNPQLAAMKGFDCANECQCILDRKRAIVTPITIMTYVLYLCHMNLVKDKYDEDGGIPPFDKRDIVICDEVHKMPNIVQNFCSPEFNTTADISNFDQFITFANEHSYLDEDEKAECTLENLKKYQYGIVESGSKMLAYDFYKKYLNIQSILCSKIDMVHQYFEDMKEKGVEIVKADKKVLYATSWLETRHQHFTNLPLIIDEVGPDKMVVNSVFNPATKEFNKDEFKVNCVFEEFMVKKFFNDQSLFEVMMTATVGDAELFRREIGVDLMSPEDRVKDYCFFRIPSTFNFEKSPIFFVPNYKLSYALKEQNLPFVVNLVNAVVKAHQGQKGIIHTGSYDFAHKLYEMSETYGTRNRFLTYRNAREKVYALDEYLSSTDKILVGPTLVEGINLPDDDCRFMIVMKVPYPSLGDQLVKAKKDVIPNWYIGSTLKSIIQSLGRGIRHKEDWCRTYVLDGCFASVFNQTRSNLTPELVRRVQFVNP